MAVKKSSENLKSSSTGKKTSKKSAKKKTTATKTKTSGSKKKVKKTAKKKASGSTSSTKKKQNYPSILSEPESQNQQPEKTSQFELFERNTTTTQEDYLSSEEILIIAGEHSGDLLGAALITALRKYGVEKVLATGGPKMFEKGAELVEDLETMDVVGFVEALKAYSRLKKLAKRIVDMCVERKIELAILIDYPGFNLRIAEMLKEKGIRVAYLVSPQIWAWNYKRIESIRKNVDLMLPLFEFEQDLYRSEGIDAKAVGHPLVSEIDHRLQSQPELTYAEKKGKPLIGLLPGSRVSEIKKLLIPVCEAARLIKKDHPSARFLLPGVNKKAEPFIEETLTKYEDLDIQFLPDRSLRVMQASDLVVLASGTATVETAFFRKPMVIIYRMGIVNFLIASLFIRTRVIGLANLLSKDGPVGLELLQSEVTPDNICKEVNKILADHSYRRSIEQRLDSVRESLGDGKPAVKAAKIIAKRFFQN